MLLTRANPHSDAYLYLLAIIEPEDLFQVQHAFNEGRTLPLAVLQRSYITAYSDDCVACALRAQMFQHREDHLVFLVLMMTFHMVGQLAMQGILVPDRRPCLSWGFIFGCCDRPHTRWTWQLTWPDEPMPDHFTAALLGHGAGDGAPAEPPPLIAQFFAQPQQRTVLLQRRRG